MPGYTNLQGRTNLCARCAQPLPSGSAPSGPLSSLCGRCRGERTRVLGAVRALLTKPDVLILDTETTGLKGAEVIEVALIDTQGRTRLETLVRPKAQMMNPHAQRVHGLSLNDLRDQPTWPEVLPELVRIAGDATILAWNAPFDARMLEQTSACWGLPHPKLLFVCAMRLYARLHGRSSFGLHKAVVAEGLDDLLTRHASHRALGDVIFVLELLKHVTESERAENSR